MMVSAVTDSGRPACWECGAPGRWGRQARIQTSCGKIEVPYCDDCWKQKLQELNGDGDGR